MAILSKGTTFGSTEQVNSDKLNNLVDAATFVSGGSGTCETGGGLGISGNGRLQVEDAGISSTKLGTDSVTTAKITDLSVTTAKIAADAITSAKIANDAVDTEHIANSVSLGGNPTATTQSTGSDSTRIATTAFVKNLMDTFAPSAPSGDGMSNSGSVTLPGGLIIKYGKNVDSTSDNAQVFSFPTDFPNNHFVTITNNAKAGGEAVFPVTSILDGSFTINRSDAFNNPQSFHFISIGN